VCPLVNAYEVKADVVQYGGNFLSAAD